MTAKLLTDDQLLVFERHAADPDTSPTQLRSDLARVIEAYHVLVWRNTAAGMVLGGQGADTYLLGRPQ